MRGVDLTDWSGGSATGLAGSEFHHSVGLRWAADAMARFPEAGLSARPGAIASPTSPCKPHGAAVFSMPARRGPWNGARAPAASASLITPGSQIGMCEARQSMRVSSWADPKYTPDSSTHRRRRSPAGRQGALGAPPHDQGNRIKLRRTRGGIRGKNQRKRQGCDGCGCRPYATCRGETSSGPDDERWPGWLRHSLREPASGRH